MEQYRRPGPRLVAKERGCCRWGQGVRSKSRHRVASPPGPVVNRAVLVAEVPNPTRGPVARVRWEGRAVTTGLGVDPPPVVPQP